jgi:hypothetical protein
MFCLINDILSCMTDRRLDTVYTCSATVITTSPQYSISEVVQRKYEERQFLSENNFHSFFFSAHYPTSWHFHVRTHFEPSKYGILILARTKHCCTFAIVKTF